MLFRVASASILFYPITLEGRRGTTDEFATIQVMQSFIETIAYVQGCHGQGKMPWKMKFFPGQGKVREFCKWSGKFRKDFESQRKIREFEIAMSGRLRKIIYSVQREEKTYCLMR